MIAGLLAVLTILLAIVLFLIYQMLVELRALNASLSAPGGILDAIRRRKETVSASGDKGPPTTVWVFRNQRWHVETSSASPDYLPGPPPTTPGSFEGQRIKTVCARRV